MLDYEKDFGALTEKQARRLEILRNYKQNERAAGNYCPEEGIYNVVINGVDLKTNKNGNPFIQLSCSNLSKKGYKTMYASYYLTDGTDDSSITDLRCLLSEYDQDDFTETEIIDDYSILEKIRVLIGEYGKLVIENQNGFLSSKVYKEVPVE